MAEYGSQRSEQPQNFNFEPIVRGLEIIFLTGTVKSVSKFNCIRKNGVKKWMKKMPLDASVMHIACLTQLWTLLPEYVFCLPQNLPYSWLVTLKSIFLP